MILHVRLTLLALLVSLLAGCTASTDGPDMPGGPADASQNNAELVPSEQDVDIFVTGAGQPASAGPIEQAENCIWFELPSDVLGFEVNITAVRQDGTAVGQFELDVRDRTSRTGGGSGDRFSRSAVGEPPLNLWFDDGDAALDGQPPLFRVWVEPAMPQGAAVVAEFTVHFDFMLPAGVIAITEANGECGG